MRKPQDLVRDRTANATIVTAFAILVLIGAAGAATDTIQWTLLKRKLQSQADSAALAAARSKVTGGSTSTAAASAIARYTTISLLSSQVENPPGSGTWSGNTKAVRVTVTADATLPFSKMFTGRSATISANSTAAAVGYGDFCVLALETADATGVKATGNTNATLGCGIATNAQGTKAIEFTGSSYVTATSLMAVGKISAGSGNMPSTTVQIPYAMAQADPYAGLPTPDVPGGCTTKLKVNPNETVAISNPGGTACYAEMDLKGTVTFAPGIYLLNGGDFKVNATASISGTDVIFILTSSNIFSNPSSVANLTINGGAYLNLAAPSSGSYSGILFYQDRRAADDSGTNDVSGNSTSTLQGAFYFPAQRIKFTGNSGLNTNCLQIVARRVEFTGSSTISNTCPTNSGASSFGGYQVRLVE